MKTQRITQSKESILMVFKNVQINKSYIVIGLTSFLIGLLLLIYIGTSLQLHLPHDLNFSVAYAAYKYFYFSVLTLPFFFVPYFIIRPLKTINGRKKLIIAEMILGGSLIVLTLIWIGFRTYHESTRVALDDFLVSYLLELGLNSILLLPGVFLLIHGAGWRSILDWKGLIKT